jgi:hypothetical protein
MVCLNEFELPIVCRTKGLLTGSRSAALLAMVPLLDACEAISKELLLDSLPLAPKECCQLFHPSVEPPADAWQHYFPETGDRLEPEPDWGSEPDLGKHLGMLAWAYNIFTFGVTPEASTVRMQCIAHFLQTTWGFLLKEDSKEVLLPRGHPVVALPPDFKQVLVMDALGHRIASDGNCAPCVAKSLHGSWQAYCRNFGKLTRGFTAHSRCQLFSRVVAPCMHFRYPRWTWTKCLAATLRRQQSRMLGPLLKMLKLPTESWQAFWVRRQVVLTKAHCIWRDQEWPMRVLVVLVVLVVLLVPLVLVVLLAVLLAVVLLKLQAYSSASATRES